MIYGIYYKLLQRIRHSQVTVDDYKVLMSRVLKPTMFLDPKWHDAQVITGRNAVRCGHNKKILMAMAQSTGLKPIVWKATDTIRSGEALSSYPNIQQIVNDIPDSSTENLPAEFMYLFIFCCYCCVCKST